MYRVSPKRKKHIVETEIFRKKDYEIRRSETWRKGWVLISNEIDFADPNIKDEYGDTALSEAQMRNKDDTVDLLIRNGAKAE